MGIVRLDEEHLPDFQELYTEFFMEVIGSSITQAGRKRGFGVDV